MKERIFTTHYTVDTHGRARFRATVVSDTHECEPGRIAFAVSAIKPDVILLAGDIVEAKTNVSAALHDGERSENAYALLRALCRIAPVYYGLGNHEAHLTPRQREKIAGTGVVLLEDKFARIKLNGHVTVIGAVSPGLPGDPPSAKTLSMLEDFRRQDGYRILLCHQPEHYAEWFCDPRDDLAIAGHAHGGQWRIFGRAIYAPGQGIFPKYTRGMYGNLLVSAGAHNSEVIPRINDPCEILDVEFI